MNTVQLSKDQFINLVKSSKNKQSDWMCVGEDTGGFVFWNKKTGEYCDGGGLLHTKIEPKWLDKPDSNGLWWWAKKDDLGKWHFAVVSVTLKNLDGYDDLYSISQIGSDAQIGYDECYTFEDDFAGHKWKRVLEPLPPE